MAFVSSSAPVCVLPSELAKLMYGSSCGQGSLAISSTRSGNSNRTYSIVRTGISDVLVFNHPHWDVC